MSGSPPEIGAVDPGARAPEIGSAAAVESPALRPGGIRWGIAFFVVAVMIGILAAAAILLTTQPRPEALAFVPSGSSAVVEIRPDLPGAQRQNLGNLLAHFPGFADQADLGAKIDEALDQLVRRTSNGKRSYLGDLKPYAAGPIYLVLPALPRRTVAGQPISMLAILTTDGSVGCGPLEEGRTVTVERHRDLDLRVQSGGPGQRTCAVSGRFLIVGDLESVKAAIDAQASRRNITSDPGYSAAAQAVAGDHLAWAYLDGRQAGGLLARSPGPTGTAGPLAGFRTPDWMAVQLRLSDGGPILEAAMPDPRLRPSSVQVGAAGAPTSAPDAVSAIASRLPGSTIAALEVHGFGSAVSAMLGAAGRDPAATGGLSQLNAALSLLGGADGLLGPLDQASIVVYRSGTTLGGGLVVHSTDSRTTNARFDQIRGLLALTGQLKVREQDYKGTRIVLFPLAGILGIAGASASGSIPPGALPTDLALALAVHGDILLVGIDAAFIKAVIDTTAGSSLADQPGYRAAIGQAGSPNLGQGYVDLPAIVAAVEQLLPAAERATFTRDVKPYLVPLGTVGLAATGSDGLVRVRLIITVR